MSLVLRSWGPFSQWVAYRRQVPCAPPGHMPRCTGVATRRWSTAAPSVGNTCGIARPGGCAMASFRDRDARPAGYVSREQRELGFGGYHLHGRGRARARHRGQRSGDTGRDANSPRSTGRCGEVPAIHPGGSCVRGLCRHVRLRHVQRAWRASVACSSEDRRISVLERKGPALVRTSAGDVSVQPAPRRLARLPNRSWIGCGAVQFRCRSRSGRRTGPLSCPAHQRSASRDQAQGRNGTDGTAPVPSQARRASWTGEWVERDG